MTAILYPVASSADAALSAPTGRAAREREAAGLAGAAVAFVTEPAGPAFATRDAALDAYAGRIEDDRPGRAATVPAEDRYCRLAEVVGEGAPPRPVKPAYADGRRWPKAPPRPVRTVWRLQVSYWRISEGQGAAPADQARRARRAGQALDAEALRALTRQSLQAVKPQQPLDIGLFETRLPEAPHIVVPDE